MRKLLILLILSFLSLNSLAKIGDVYFCETKSYSLMSLELEALGNYETNNFKFKFMKNKIVFDDKFEPSFASRELPITFGDEEYFIARSPHNDMPEYAIYSYGDFYFSLGRGGGVFTVVAECDTF
jgi:hypothetical protein